MNVRVVPFAMRYYDDVLALWRRCEGVGLSEDDSRSHTEAYLDRNPGMSFIAMAGDMVVGAVLAGHDGRRAYIHHLAVAPAYRRQGVARQLVDRCLVALADVGIRKCHLLVFNSNTKGIAFWKAMGWTLRSDVGILSKTIEAVSGDPCQSDAHQ